MAQRSLALLFCLLTVCLTAGVSRVTAQIAGEEEKAKLSDASMSVYEARQEEIKKEIAALRDHAWAGEYYYGDGLGVNVYLAIAPRAGFVFTWHGCLGIYDLNYGAVEWTGEAVRLIFTYPNSREGFQGIAPELIPVRWGKRHYFIPSDKIIEFCNAINAGFEPGSGPGLAGNSFLLRRGDEKKEVEGQPTIPARYLEYLLKKPIKTRILNVSKIKVEEDKDSEMRTRITTVTLDTGRAEGVRQGMEFFVRDSDNEGTARILVVGEHTSEAEVEQRFFERDVTIPAVGWKLATSIH